MIISFSGVGVAVGSGCVNVTVSEGFLVGVGDAIAVSGGAAVAVNDVVTVSKAVFAVVTVAADNATAVSVV